MTDLPVLCRTKLEMVKRVIARFDPEEKSRQLAEAEARRSAEASAPSPVHKAVAKVGELLQTGLELAASKVVGPPSDPAVQEVLDNLQRENQALREEVERCHRALEDAAQAHNRTPTQPMAPAPPSDDPAEGSQEERQGPSEEGPARRRKGKRRT